MKYLIFVSFCIAFSTAQVLELDSQNFDEAIKDKAAFVEFYAPWCGHCKNLAPAYDKVGEVFSKVPGVVIAKVDADQHRELGSRFGVHGFPTLKWFQKGSTEPEDYSGGRTAEDIISFINGKTGSQAKIKKAPSSVVELNADNFDSIVMDPSKDVLVEFYAPWCGHCKKLIPDYEKLASAFTTETNIVISKLDADHYKDIAGKYGVSGFPTIFWFGVNKQNPEKYDKGRDLESFVNFINQKTGSKRLSSGRLQGDAGKISSLDKIAASFSTGDQAALIKQAEGIVSTLNDEEKKNAQYYLKVMQTIQSRGNDFPKNEIARLEKIIEGSVTPSKLDEFTIKQNILSSFN